MPDERADSDASSSADDEAPLASPSAKGEGWIGAEDVMARPPKACESAGTFGRLSPLGESTRWGEWWPSAACKGARGRPRETVSREILGADTVGEFPQPGRRLR